MAFYLVAAEPVLELLFKCIQDADIDVRAELYKHVVLSGGSSMYPGLPGRLEKEVKQLYLTRVLNNDVSRLSVSAPPKAHIFRNSKSTLTILHVVSTWSSWVVLSLPRSWKTTHRLGSLRLNGRRKESGLW